MFCARAEIEHVIATTFQPGGRSENSPCNQALSDLLRTLYPKSVKGNQRESANEMTFVRIYFEQHSAKEGISIAS